MTDRRNFGSASSEDLSALYRAIKDFKVDKTDEWKEFLKSGGKPKISGVYVIPASAIRAEDHVSALTRVVVEYERTGPGEQPMLKEVAGRVVAKVDEGEPETVHIEKFELDLPKQP